MLNRPQRQLSPERKAMYYTGGAIALFGLLLFLSVFISGAMHFGDFSDFEGRTRSMALRAVFGMILMIVGGIIAGVGARGAAGSGIILDPEKTRRDLEPWNRMAGGMLDDALSEVDVARKIADRHTQTPTPPPAAQPAVKIRCRNCQALNHESARFCSRCGQAI